MTTKLTDFDLSSLLDSEEAIAEYLNQVMVDGDQDELLRAFSHVAKAQGMSEIARKSGLGRESLYKALTPGSKPRFETMARISSALGLAMQFTVSPMKAAAQ